VLRLLLFITFFIVLDIYAFQAFRFMVKSRWGVVLYFFITAFVFAGLFYQFTSSDRRNLGPLAQFFIVTFVIMLVCKLFIILTMFGEDLFRFAKATLSKLFGSGKEFTVDSRRTFVSKLALGLAAIPFASILYGVIKGRYNFKVLKYTLHFEDLPDAFDGYRLTQISDIHSGSLDNKEKIEYAVNLINEQASDTILFTGDMVNNEASELEPWIDVFGKLKATDGKFAVLGNHDYGDYVRWPSEEAKKANLDRLIDLQKKMGFDLLRNEHRFFEKNGQRLALIGVENWGAGGFKKAGDINKAIDGLDGSDFKILMSHDPSHWEYEVKDHSSHFHLTLSGHTHGAQFGIEIPGLIKLSPVQFRYKYWAGIYEQLGQYINVNRGFGYLAFPGRVGIWPEITVIELKKRGKTV
jgi:predicted MPP superfamily phosphohydrolase